MQVPPDTPAALGTQSQIEGVAIPPRSPSPIGGAVRFHGAVERTASLQRWLEHRLDTAPGAATSSDRDLLKIASRPAREPGPADRRRAGRGHTG